MSFMRIEEHDRFGKYIPVMACDEEKKLFYMKDKYIGFAFVCFPHPSCDPSTYDILLNQFNWPKDTFLQVSLISNEDILRQVENMEYMRYGLQDDLLIRTIQNRKSFLLEHTEKPVENQNGTYVRNFTLLISVKYPINELRPSEKELNKILEKQESLRKSLETAHFNPQKLNRMEYARIMGTILDLDKDASWRDPNFDVDNKTPICEQVLDWDKELVPEFDHIKIGNTYARTLGVNKFPKKVMFGITQSLIGDVRTGNRGIRCPFIITASIYFPDQYKTKNKLKNKRNITTKQAFGPLLKWVPELSQKKKDLDLLYKDFEENERPIKVNLSIALFARSLEELAGYTSQAKDIWSTSQFKIMEDKAYTVPFFLNTLPFNCDKAIVEDIHRYRTMTPKRVIPLLPIYADWKGTGTPVMNFIGRNGQLMTLDLFDSDTNYNVSVAAESGSGKSFATNNLISSYRSIGAQVWVLDVGKSYQNLCEELDGEFIAFTKDKDVCLNPFSIIQDWEDEADIVIGIVEAMAVQKEALTDFQRTSLERICKELWDEKRTEINIDDIATRCLAEKDKAINELGTRLFPFTTNGQHGRYYNGKNNARFDGDFSVLELEELKGRKQLQKLVLMTLIYQIQQEMYLGNRSRKKIVIIDEAWDLLADGDIAKFIEHGYRRFRKYNGAAITITQGVKDLYQNPTGIAIAENSAIKILLNQQNSAIDQLEEQKLLPLNDAGYRLLKTVHTVKGEYSEAMLITNRGIGIGRLIVNDFDKLLYSTAPDDISLIHSYREKGLNLADSIEKILADRVGIKKEERYVAA